MLIPMSCFSCNNRVGALHPFYLHLLATNHTPVEAFKTLGLDAAHNLCCRNMLLTQPDLYNTLVAQSTNNSEIPLVTTVTSNATRVVCDPR
jgi:DNA-directed RNA polymerase subunit N (RpoN/RPB10)